MKNKAKPVSETARQWAAIGAKDAEIDRLKAELARAAAPTPRADKSDLATCPGCKAKFRLPLTPNESKPVSDPAVYVVTSDAAGTKDTKE